MEFAWLALGAFILLAYTLEAITGFGSIIIALSLGMTVLPIDLILPILVALSVPMSAILAFRNRHSINTQLLFNMILPSMLLGTVTGYFIKPYLNEGLLKIVFGILIIWFSSREIWRMKFSQKNSNRPSWITRVITFFSGICQGLFASGGPLLVYAIAGTKIDKSAFRATMVTVWFSMNTFLLTAFLIDGRLQPLAWHVVYYLPLLFIAIKLGNYLHHKLDEKYFRLGVYYLLFITGSILLGSQFTHLL